MQYFTIEHSPLGDLILTSDGQALTGLWFADSRHPADITVETTDTAHLPVFQQTHLWLAQYFTGRIPDCQPALRVIGSPFEQLICRLLQQIPYGQTVSYRQIARQAAAQMGIARMSAQAVGGAVGRNPIAILIPCHRVIGSDGSLTGYAGGLVRKRFLLQLEKADITSQRRS